MKVLFTLIFLFSAMSYSLAQVDTLSRKIETLKEVEVRTRKQLLDHQLDKTVVNVQSMITASTSNTLEVLERIPGIAVSRDGEISLNGRSGVLVLIDNKALYMSAGDLAAYLKSLPGSSLDKVELMDNPPAKYDASGAAVINIRLKKNRDAGFTGNVSVGVSQGRYGRMNTSANLNYHNKLINVYLNIGHYTETTYNTDIFDRKFFDEDQHVTSIVDLSNRHVQKPRGINVNAGADYSISQKTTVGISMNLHEGRKSGWFNYESRAFTAAMDLKESSNGFTTEMDTRRQAGINLNITHKISDMKELSADVNYFNNRGDGNRILKSYYYHDTGGADSVEQFEYLLEADADIYVAKADYVHQIHGNMKFEGGLKSSFIQNNNENDHFDVNSSGKVQDLSRSNHFRYRENINAAYVTMQKKWKKFGIQAGIRAENTVSHGELFGNAMLEGSRFERSYTGLYPTIFINHKLDSAGTRDLVLSFNKRISRPNYHSLNPFVYFRDKYSLSTGNPMLGAQNQYRLELKYQHKQWFWTALSVNRFTNVIFPTTEARGELFITRPDNVGRGYMVILNNGFNIKVNSWWQLNSTLRFARLGLRGTAYGEPLNPDANVARIDVMNMFAIAKNLSAEIGGYYASRDLNGQSITSGMYRVNAAAQKKLWKERASVKISVDDMFRTWVYRNRSISLKQAEYYQEIYSDTQRFGVSISYKFGKEKSARKRRQGGVNEEEKSRLE